MRPGQPIEQRALARVRVSHKSHRWHRHSFSPLPLLTPDPSHRLQIGLELIYPALDFSTVGFKLRFAGASGSDAAAKLRHGFAPSGKARKHVLELRQLYLQLAFPCPRMPRKNVQD